MTSSTSSSERDGPGPAATIASVLLAAALVTVSAIALHRVRQSQPSVGVAPDVFWRQKILADGPFRCVLAGDSRVYRGLAPEAIAPALGLSSGDVLNFGFGANAWGPAYLQRLRRLVRLDPPGLLVVAPTPGSFTPGSLERNAFLTREQKWGSARASEFARLRNRLEAPLERLAQSTAFRPVTEPELRRELSPAVIDERFYRQDYRPTGWVASDSRPRQTDFYFKRFERKFRDNQVAPEIIEGFIAFVDEMTRNGVAVYGVRMPIHPGLAEREAALSGLDWSDLITRFESAGGVWLTIAGGDYETFDGSHLIAPDARRFSRDLAEAIAATR